MRVKLCFDSFQQLGRRKKVCFFVGEGTCKKVADLNYLIQRRFFSNGDGCVALFLEDFFVPPGEDIGIIHENDILKVQFTSEKKGKYRAPITNGVNTSESESTESSSDSEEERVPVKKKLKAGEPDKLPVDSKRNPKKFIPLSKLGISKKESSSSSSSESTDSSDSESDLVNIKNKKTDKKQTLNSKQKDSVTISSDTTSSSSESNDEIRKDQTISYLKETSKVDFNISGFSASTPGANLSTGAGRKSILKNSSSKENSFGKRVAAKDKYKNVSQVFTYTPDTTKETTKNSATSCEVSIDTQNENTLDKSHGGQTNVTKEKKETLKQETGNINNTEDTAFSNINGVTSLQNSHEQTSVSGRTLRNRRRRQRKLAKQREQESKPGKDVIENEEERKNGKGSITESLGSTVQHIIKSMEQKVTEKAESSEEEKKEQNSMVTKQNYEVLHPLMDCPIEGSKIAFKVLELDESYQPFVSDYKEAVVVSYNENTDEVQLRLSDGFYVEDKRNGKFEMETEENTGTEENQEEPKLQNNNTIMKEWKLLLNPRLIEAEDFEF